MSKHKMAVPGTYVVGSSLKVNHLGQPVIGLEMPLRTADGTLVGHKPPRREPMWNRGKILGYVSHFKNAAAKRRAGGDPAKALPRELVQVPIYRGMPASLANDLRAGQRAIQRKSVLEQVRKALELRREGDAAGAEEALVTEPEALPEAISA